MSLKAEGRDRMTSWRDGRERRVLVRLLTLADYSTEADHHAYRCLNAARVRCDQFGRAAYAGMHTAVGETVDAGIPIDANRVAFELERQGADPAIRARLRDLAADLRETLQTSVAALVIAGSARNVT